MRIINIVHNFYATEMATAVYKLIKEISVTIFMKAMQKKKKSTYQGKKQKILKNGTKNLKAFLPMCL